MDLPAIACHGVGMNGDQIRRLREARGWTQEQLAQAVGVGQRTIGNWERGETVPRNRAGRLDQVLAAGVGDDDDPLTAASEVALIAELLRRAEARQRRR